MNLPVPEVLNVTSGNRSKNCDVFHQKWTNFALATGIEEKQEKTKVATLLTIVGSEALEIYNTFEWNEQEEKTVEQILLKFEKFCKPKKNITYERYVLMTRKQKDENVDDFVKDLRIQANLCEYGSIKDQIIKDAFVLGIRDTKLREHFLKDSDLTIEKALTIARAAEKAQEQVAIIEGNKNEEIMKISKINGDKMTRNESKRECRYCGKNHIFKKSECPAFGKECSKCKLRNHFASRCRTRNVRIVDETNESEENEEKEYYIQ